MTFNPTRELPYLVRLALRLAAGLDHWPSERRLVHQRFVRSQQQPEGGFTGREGGGDLYYTSFAIRALELLGGLSADDCSSLARYLAAGSQQQVSVVDLVSWLYGLIALQAADGPNLLANADPAWPDQLAQTLEFFRRPDGGYAKSQEGSAGSTYHSFLVALCYELIDRPIPEPERLLAFVRQRQREDGGFVEIAPMKRGGTNPTAAAVALLQLLDNVDQNIRDGVADFLSSVRADDGGFQANTRIPFGDSLSTFTGLLTLRDLGLTGILDERETVLFIESLEFPTGGFRGAQWDTQADVEYTFYALGTLALLAQP